jgi:fructose-specific phosphotransferase system IIC component
VIAPMQGGWVKIQNNELVISRGSYKDAVLEAEKWNTEWTTEAPVANEKVGAAAVKVVAGEGTITILNAAGKRAVISNVLGQTVANAVLTSDNATIEAPKGILVVAVEGENAVKAVVK